MNYSWILIRNNLKQAFKGKKEKKSHLLSIYSSPASGKKKSFQNEGKKFHRWKKVIPHRNIRKK